MMRRLLLALLVLAAPVLGPAAVSQSRAAPKSFTQDDLRKAEAARDAALARLKALETASAAAARDASAIDADLVAAASDATAREEAAYAAEEQLMLLSDETRTAMSELERDQSAMQDLFAALMTFGSRRPPALATSPEDVSKAVRAAILMSDAAPALNRRAEDLRQRLADLHGLADATRAQQANLTLATSALDARRQEIAALAEEKRRASSTLDAEAASVRTSAKKLADEAETLRDLLASLARSAPPRPSVKPPTGKTTPAAKPPATKPAAPTTKPPASAAAPKAGVGTPLYPVVGNPLRRFGRTIEGQKQEGLTLTARPGATVIAPLDARVQFAGPFRTYGQMAILDVGGDVLVVVSGMEGLYPEAGQWVLAGEPIGRMTDRKSPSPELYLEVRRKGQPVDPESWLGRRG
jgi:septal ring factor EnvC (AmiA/AmiB activator)